MPPKGPNSKKESGRAKKEENEAKKKEAASADKERKVAAKWEEGSKSNKAKEEKEEKKKADAARKAEAARLLAEEEASLSVVKPKVPKVQNKSKPASAGKKKETVSEVGPAGPGAIAAGGGLDGEAGAGPAVVVEKGKDEEGVGVQSFAATGIDDALDLLNLVNAKTDKASVGQAAASLEKHPERRFKAAFEAYQDKQLPIIREEHPGLRLQQYKDLLYKQFQKSLDNPFNQTLVSYDATKEERVEALKKKQAQVEERLREKAA